MTETFYLYHIPGKKIGVTRDLNKRVTQTQGYKPGEYEVLESSTDIDYISEKEIELQKSYGYRKDHKHYKNLFNDKLTSSEEEPLVFSLFRIVWTLLTCSLILFGFSK